MRRSATLTPSNSVWLTVTSSARPFSYVVLNTSHLNDESKVFESRFITFMTARRTGEVMAETKVQKLSARGGIPPSCCCIPHARSAFS